MAVLIISWVAASTVWADNCSKSAELHAQALKQSSLAEKTRLLQQVTVLCPNRAEAWNEIGYIREQQGRLDDAKKQYQRALQVNPSFTASYAGLGDIQNTQKNYVQAAVNYQAFLRQLDADVQNGDPYGLAQHRLEYKQKLAVVTAKLGSEEVISADEITRSLSGKRVKTRGLGNIRVTHASYKDKAAIDIRIQFDFGSDKVNTASVGQLEQLSKALSSHELQENKINIIGHTDNVGSEQANLTLSRRRAEGVKRALVDKGIASARLMTEGKGEAEPLASNETADGRTKNRRVTFVNAGI